MKRSTDDAAYAVALLALGFALALLLTGSPHLTDAAEPVEYDPILAASAACVATDGCSLSGDALAYLARTYCGGYVVVEVFEDGSLTCDHTYTLTPTHTLTPTSAPSVRAKPSAMPNTSTLEVLE